MIDEKETALTQARYQRIAPFYDAIEVLAESGDVQNLDFPDESFNDVVATFVFCSVPNPILGWAFKIPIPFLQYLRQK